MNKKGFTLIELLAVIVILAIIALIATPIILNVIDDARKESAIQSLKGYIKAAENAVSINDLEGEVGFPSPDTDGCYVLEELNPYIEVKGNKPELLDNAKVCMSDGTVTSIDEIKIDGYKMSFELGEGYIIDGEIVEEDTESEPKNGIASKNYTQGDKVSYLGYNWLVMEDKGESSKLVMDGYLSSDELKANLPDDVIKGVTTENGMTMCFGWDFDQNKYNLDGNNWSNYCYENNGTTNNYSWDKTVIKPTIEKWLNNKMEENNKEKENELIQMTFTDETDTYTNYIRIPLYDEVRMMHDAAEPSTGVYDGDTTYYMFRDYSYWTLTKSSNTFVHVFWNNGEGEGGLQTTYFVSHKQVVPVITVKEN